MRGSEQKRSAPWHSKSAGRSRLLPLQSVLCKPGQRHPLEAPRQYSKVRRNGYQCTDRDEPTGSVSTRVDPVVNQADLSTR